MIVIRRLLIVVLFMVASALGAQSASPVISILDFTDNTGDESLSWLGPGLADMLITDLASSSLTIVDRAALGAIFDEQALALSGITDDEALELGRLVSADILLSGTIHKAGASLRIDARIVEVASGSVLDGVSVDGPMDAIFSMEAELAREICRVMDVEAPEGLGSPGTQSLPAARTYYQGLVLQESGRPEDAADLFEEASRLDPLYAKPRLSLEESWRLLADFQALRRQREVNAVWRKIDAIKTRLAANPFINDTQRIIDGASTGDTSYQNDPSFGTAASPQIALWNLQMAYWEVGFLVQEAFEDQETLDACLREMVALSNQAEEIWVDDEWFPEIYYQSVLALKFLGEWEELKLRCERIFLTWPDYRMNWAVEGMYADALEALAE